MKISSIKTKNLTTSKESKIGAASRNRTTRYDSTYGDFKTEEQRQAHKAAKISDCSEYTVLGIIVCGQAQK